MGEDLHSVLAAGVCAQARGGLIGSGRRHSPALDHSLGSWTRPGSASRHPRPPTPIASCLPSPRGETEAQKMYGFPHGHGAGPPALVLLPPQTWICKTPSLCLSQGSVLTLLQMRKQAWEMGRGCRLRAGKEEGPSLNSAPLALWSRAPYFLRPQSPHPANGMMETLPALGPPGGSPNVRDGLCCLWR